MKPQMYAVAAIALLAAGFGAGWTANGWRVGKEKAEQEVSFKDEEITEANNKIQQVSTKLGDVVTRSQEAADSTTAMLNRLASLEAAYNRKWEVITDNTERLNNEISGIGPAKCVFSPELGKLWLNVGKTANSGRFTLYGTGSKTED